MINVHTFDSKLKNIFRPSTKNDIYQKKDKFMYLITRLSDPNAINAVNSIILDLTTGCNYQIENDIDASDVLVDLLENIDNKDFIVLLNEQLSDMTNLGMCPSGRCTRLLQLYIAFYNKN